MIPIGCAKQPSRCADTPFLPTSYRTRQSNSGGQPKLYTRHNIVSYVQLLGHYNVVPTWPRRAQQTTGGSERGANIAGLDTEQPKSPCTPRRVAWNSAREGGSALRTEIRRQVYDEEKRAWGTATGTVRCQTATPSVASHCRPTSLSHRLRCHHAPEARHESTHAAPYLTRFRAIIISTFV
jgi:hypothetical protein